MMLTLLPPAHTLLQVRRASTAAETSAKAAMVVAEMERIKAEERAAAATQEAQDAKAELAHAAQAHKAESKDFQRSLAAAEKAAEAAKVCTAVCVSAGLAWLCLYPHACVPTG